MSDLLSRINPRVQKLFEKIVECENPLEAIQAVYELGDLGAEPDARMALIQSLIVPNSEVKLTILEVLNQPDFWHIDIVNPVKELLSDEDSEVRLSAAELLGAVKNNLAVPALLQKLQESDTEPALRYKIMAALANIGDKRACPILEDFLNSSDWEDRYHAIDAIGMIGNPNSVKNFIKMFEDPHPKVRENAVLSAGSFKGNKTIISALRKLLDDQDEAVLAATIFMLGELRDRNAVHELSKFLFYENDEIKIITCEALGKLKHPAAIRPLMEIICDVEPDVRRVVRETLDVFTNEQLVEPVIDAIMADEKIKYIKWRIQKFKDQKISIKQIRKLNLPLWAEALLTELALLELEEND